MISENCPVSMERLDGVVAASNGDPCPADAGVDFIAGYSEQYTREQNDSVEGAGNE